MNNLSKAFVLSVAIALTGCTEKDPQQFIKEGQVLFEKGDLKEAQVQFKNALQLNPQLAEAYYGLALLDEKEKNWSAMKKNLEDTLTNDPNHIEAHIKLGLINRLAKQLDLAKKHVAAALKLSTDNIDATMLKASIYHDEGQEDKAMELLGKILGKDNLNAEAISLKTSILLSEKQYDKALAVINFGIEAHPELLGLGMLKIQLYQELKNEDGIINTFKILISRHPKNKTLYYSQLKALIDMGRFKQAEKELYKTINIFPKDVDMKLLLVTSVSHRDKIEAEKLLKEYITTHPKKQAFKFRLAEYYIANQRIPEAKSLLTGIVNADPIGQEGLKAKIQLASLAWMRKDKDTTSKIVEEALATDATNSDGLMLRSRLRLDNKDIDLAISDLRIVLRDQPNSEQAMLLMAKAYLLQGEMEMARSYWRKVLEVNRSSMPAIIPLTTMLLKRGDIDRALELINKSIKADPKNPTLLELLFKLHISQKDWVGAEVVINTIKETAQREVAAQILEAVLAQNRNQYKQAIQIYKGVLSSQPNNIIALKGLAQSYQAFGDQVEWISYLKIFTKKNPMNIQALNMLGRAYSRRGEWEVAQKTLQQVVQAKSKSSETYSLLASVLLQQGKSEEATETYLLGLQSIPDNTELLMKLAKQYERTKQFDKAIVIYDSLIKRFPDGLEIVNNLAYILVTFNADDASKKRALMLVKGFKGMGRDNPFWLDTYGWVLLKVGDIKTAIIILQKAIAGVKDNAAMHYHLAEAFYAAGEIEKSKAEVKRALSLADSNETFNEIEQAKKLLNKLNLNP